jgi:hypothetical protein
MAFISECLLQLVNCNMPSETATPTMDAPSSSGPRKQSLPGHKKASPPHLEGCQTPHPPTCHPVRKRPAAGRHRTQGGTRRRRHARGLSQGKLTPHIPHRTRRQT